MTNEKVYFMQHGLAVDKTVDPERPLSEAGIQQTEAMAERLRGSELSISSIFHSGRLRASQTAGIIASVLGIPSTPVIDGLSPNDDVTILASKLDTDDALYVGHLPHLEKMVAHLVTGDEAVNIMKFQNSGIACLEKIDGRYLIKWLLTPALTDDT